MGNWAWLIWTAVCAGAGLAAVAGGLLLAFAFAGQRKAIRFSTDDEPHGGCDCCGYELAGLEDGYCPECGWRYVDNQRLPGRIRLRTGAAGLALVAVAVVGGISPHVVRHGALSLLPNWALIAALPLASVEPNAAQDETVLHRELLGRLSLDKMSAADRRWLASRCAEELGAHKSERTRIATASLLTRVAQDGGGAAGAVIAGLGDSSPAVRRHVVESLAVLALADASAVQRQAVQRLMGAAMCDDDECVRRTAVEALGHLPVDAPGAAGVYARAVRDPSPSVRARALYSLYSRPRTIEPGERELAAVTWATGDPRADVREAAVFAMSRCAERLDGAVLLLGLSLRDSSPDVRQSAASCLGRLGRRAASVRDSLLSSLEDEDVGVRLAAKEALTAMGS